MGFIIHSKRQKIYLFCLLILGIISANLTQSQELNSLGQQFSVTGMQVALQIQKSISTNEIIGYEANNLPAGLTIDELTGMITGIPTEAGTYNVIIRLLGAQPSLIDNLSLLWTVTENPNPLTYEIDQSFLRSPQIPEVVYQVPPTIDETIDLTYFVDIDEAGYFVGDASYTEDKNFNSLQKALERAIENQTDNISTRILLAPGIYREQINLHGFDTESTLIIEAAEPNTVIFSGSDPWTDWAHDQDYPHLLTYEWTYNWGPYTKPWGNVEMDERALRREMLFIDDARMLQVFDFADLVEGSFYIDESVNRIWVWVPANQENPVIDVSTRKHALYFRDIYNTVFRNLIFKHYGSGPGLGALIGRDCQNVLIENSTFLNNNWAGLDFRNCENLTVRNVIANHNGHRGLGASNIISLLVENVEASYNNWRGDLGGWYGWDVGQKFLRIHGGLFRNYTATYNQAAGFWLDFDSKNIIVEDSYICDNYLVGMFIEASQGPIIVRNSTICNTRIGDEETFTDAGFFSTNTQNLILENNRIYGNEGYQIRIKEPARYRTVDNWVTGEEYQIEFNNWSIHGNYIANTSATQHLFHIPGRDSYDLSFFNNLYGIIVPDQNFFVGQKQELTDEDWRDYDLSAYIYEDGEISVPDPNNIPESIPDNKEVPDQIGELNKTTLEWNISNSTYNINPFDVIADVDFVHTSTRRTLTTQMFYEGSNVWSFRFTGTQIGQWTFSSRSDDPELNGINGTVNIIEADSSAKGFVTSQDHEWVYSGTGEAFIPQFVMAGGPHYYYDLASNSVNDSLIDMDIDRLLLDHSFTGFHSPVFCRWFDINESSCSSIGAEDPSPDIRTFRAMETLIQKTYSQGKIIHIWMWGDNNRNLNPNRWGLNGTIDNRLQRYIAARLGPLPGWTLGYGYDIDEWATSQDIEQWYQNMERFMGWDHMLGARASNHELNQLSESLNYSGYTQHRPDYDNYVAALEARPDKPTFSEDRFRIRNAKRFSDKDYNSELVRRGLWESTMAGGVANIWGNLLTDESANTGDGSSLSFDNVEEIKTYFQFFENRFDSGMIRCNELIDYGTCLYSAQNNMWIFYAIDTENFILDLSIISGELDAWIVDTQAPYAEQPIAVTGSNPLLSLDYTSDWALVLMKTEESSTPLAINNAIVYSLVLVDSISNTDIMALGDNMVVDLTLLQSFNINIRADVSGDNILGVRFVVDNYEPLYPDTVLPYALYGDNNGDYNDWIPAPGTYSIEAIPYSEVNGIQEDGQSKLIHITVVSDLPTPEPTVETVITQPVVVVVEPTEVPPVVVIVEPTEVPPVVVIVEPTEVQNELSSNDETIINANNNSGCQLDSSMGILLHFNGEIFDDRSPSQIRLNNMNIPEGTYKITLQSYDEHKNRDGSLKDTQPQEQWGIQINGVLSNVIRDIPDNKTTVIEVVDLNFVVSQNSGRAIAKHVLHPAQQNNTQKVNPNSVVAVCALLSPK